MKNIKLQKIRLSAANIKLIRSLNHSCFSNPYFTVKKIDWYFAYDKDGDVMAFISLYKEMGKCHIARVGVLKFFRGKGLQRELIKFAINWAKKHKCKVLLAECLVDNIPSNNNFIKCKFLLYKPSSHFDKELLYWKKDL